jgi:tetratricopeptide (TPR) repeat protein
VALVDSIGNGLWDERQVAWLERLEAEHANLRVVLGWCRDHDVATGLRMASSLWRFWIDRVHFKEGREWLEAMLARAPERTRARARTLYGLGFLLDTAGSNVLGKAPAAESLGIFEELGDKPGVGVALHFLSQCALHEGDYDAVRALSERALTVLREAGNLGEAGDRSHLGIIRTDLAKLSLRQENDEQARALLEEGLAAFRQVHDLRGIGYALQNLALLQRRLGDKARSRASSEEAVRLGRAVGHTNNVVGGLINLAMLAWDDGNREEAYRLLDETFEFLRARRQESRADWPLLVMAKFALADGDVQRADVALQRGLSFQRAAAPRKHIAEYLGAFADLAAQRGATERQVRLIGAATAADDLFWTSLEPPERARYEARLDATRASLGDERYDRTLAEGHCMTLEQAVDYALVSA